MYSLKLIYNDSTSFKKSLGDECFDTSKSCIIYIFSAILNENLCVEIASEIKKTIPNAVICGCTVPEIIYNGEILSEKVLVRVDEIVHSTPNSVTISYGENFIAQEVSTKIKSAATDYSADIGFLLADDNILNASNLLSLLNDGSVDTFFVDGSDGAYIEKSAIDFFVFDENEIYRDSCIVAFIDKPDGSDKEANVIGLLKDVISNDSVIPYFQGIFDNQLNQYFCYEAFMRLHSSDGKILFPLDFMESAQRNRLYIPLSLCMLGKIFDIAGERDEFFSVNVSVHEIMSRQFRAKLYELLLSTKSPERFIFELVDPESVSPNGVLFDFCKQIKSLGAGLAYDYNDPNSELSSLISTLKIDYVKIKTQPNDLNFKKIAQRILSVDKKKNVRFIAKHVETASMQKKALDDGIRYSQGYFFSKPMSADDLNISLNEIKSQASNNFDNLDNLNVNEDNSFLNKKNNFFYWGAIVLGLLTIVLVFYFAQNNQTEVKNMSDSFLVEIATGLSDKIALLIEDSKQNLSLSARYLELLADDKESMLNSLTIAKENSRFNDLYISFDGEIPINDKNESLDIDIATVYDQMSEDEVHIFSPIKGADSDNDYLLLGTPLFSDGKKIGEIYGVYLLENFAEVLSLKSFGGEAFYHLCEVDGSPIYLSGSNDNLFQDGDMYSFIGSLDIYNGHTTESIKQDMLEGNTVVLNYLINGQDRSAVMVTIPGTDWCVVSIVLSEVNLNILERISRNTIIFVVFLIVIYGAYFIVNLIMANRTRKALVQSLKSSYMLTNSLQMNIETDALTRAYSRATAVEKISLAITERRRSGDTHALAILDVDNFKMINDTYGHQTGDLYLQDFTSAIRSGLRNGDILGRLGGDEFTVLLHNVQDVSAVRKVMDRIMQNVSNISIKGVSLDSVSVSVGVVMVDEDNSGYEELNNMADSALYKAKRAGKNLCMFYGE